MKRFLSLLIVMILLVSLIGIVSVAAGSGSITISGDSSVLAGKTYTYTYKLKVSSACLANTTPVRVSGVLEIVSGGEGLFHDTIPNNTSGTLTGTVKVKVKSGASPGDTGSISLSGEYMWLDEDMEYDKGKMSKTKKVTVVEKAPTPTKDPNATPRPLEGWEIVTNSIGDAEKGAVVKGEMKDDFKIPESLLKEAVENENILEIDFGTYRCTIDPAELTDFEGIKSLNLKLDFEKAAGLSEIAGEKDVYQLHFGHSGQLPGKLTFTFEATDNKPGDMVYLYYYYGEADIVEGKMSAVVDENGMVTFDIYHCSSYFVTSEVLEGALSNFDTESAAKIEELTTALEEHQTQLDEASAQIETLTSEKTTLESAVAEAEQQVTDLEEAAVKASAEANEKDQSKYSLVVLISAVAAGVLLAILLTMLFTKAGLFRRTDEEKEAQAQKKAAKLQVKQEAKELKEQEKKAALEVKQQAKIEAMEAKKQAKEAAEQEAAEQTDDAVQQASGEEDIEL